MAPKSLSALAAAAALGSPALASGCAFVCRSGVASSAAYAGATIDSASAAINASTLLNRLAEPRTGRIMATSALARTLRERGSFEPRRYNLQKVHRPARELSRASDASDRHVSPASSQSS